MTLSPDSFLAVSPMFRRCYAGPVRCLHVPNRCRRRSPPRSRSTVPAALSDRAAAGYRLAREQPAGGRQRRRSIPGSISGCRSSDPARWRAGAGASAHWHRLARVQRDRHRLLLPLAGAHGASVLTEPRLWTPVVFGVEDFAAHGADRVHYRQAAPRAAGGPARSARRWASSGAAAHAAAHARGPGHDHGPGPARPAGQGGAEPSSSAVSSRRPG